MNSEIKDQAFTPHGLEAVEHHTDNVSASGEHPDFPEYFIPAPPVPGKIAWSSAPW